MLQKLFQNLWIVKRLQIHITYPSRNFARLMAFTSHNAKKLGNPIEYTKYTGNV